MARAQVNREQVGAQAIEYLATDTEQIAGDADVSDDWMNIFSIHAERASSKSMQDLWARVLAGEIRKPGSFSLSTLQFMSVISPDIARAINDCLPFIANNSFVPISRLLVPSAAMIYLERTGFGQFGSGLLKTILRPDQDDLFHLAFNDVLYSFRIADATHLELPSMFLTIAASELSSTLPRQFDVSDRLDSYIRSLSPSFARAGKMFVKDDIVHVSDLRKLVP